MNENIIRLVLLVLGGAIILGILWDGLRRKRQRLLTTQEQHHLRESSSETQEELAIIDQNENLMDHEEDEEDLDEHTDDDNEEDLDEDNETIDPEEDIFLDEEENHVKSQKKSIPNFISIRIMAEEGKTFGGYDLLQSLLANRLNYGEMKLFHQYADATKKQKLFSLASANEPGDFELSTMKDFETNGLIVYMNPRDHQDPLDIFDKMLAVAEDLAYDLRGELMASDDQVWTDETTNEIRDTLSV